MAGKRLLGLDYGEKRIGIAVSDDTRLIATGVESYTRTLSMKADVLHIKDICRQYDVEKIILGLPLNIDGTEGPTAEKVRAFAKRLRELTRLEVELEDERLTTVEAEDMLIEAGLKREERRKIIDKMAAVEILQGYLNTKELENRRKDTMAENINNEQEFAEDEIITLLDENDKECTFQILMTFDCEQGVYTALLPINVEGFEDDEVLIMRVTEDENGEAVLDPVESQEELDKAWETFFDTYYSEDDEDDE